jgi:hypothetical protein
VPTAAAFSIVEIDDATGAAHVMLMHKKTVKNAEATKTKSPLAGAPQRRIAILRALVTEIAKWERQASLGLPIRLPPAWQIVGNSGGVNQARWLDIMESRARARLSVGSNRARVGMELNAQLMREHDPFAYKIWLDSQNKLESIVRADLRALAARIVAETSLNE